MQYRMKNFLTGLGRSDVIDDFFVLKMGFIDMVSKRICDIMAYYMVLGMLGYVFHEKYNESQNSTNLLHYKTIQKLLNHCIQVK